MAPNIIVSRPTFPTYLLPSFNIIPFRRRTSSAAAAAAPSTSTSTSTSPHSTPDASQVPSLSSSPTSSTTDETATPPNSPPPPTYQDATTTTAIIPDLLSKSSSAVTTATKKNKPARSSSLARTQPDTLRCSTCSCDIAFSSQIVSKGFTGRYGRAYLIAPTVVTAYNTSSTQGNNSKNKGSLANVRIGKCENRQLVTGWHVVADITCVLCNAKLGWKYVDAKELSQKYKVGKFILEVERVVPFRSWEDVDVRDEEDYDDEDDVSEDEESVEEGEATGGAGRAGSRDDESGGDDGAESVRKDTSDSEVEVAFDSEDEDDLEDMFSGNWDPEVVAKRRSRRVATARKK